jgi:hypothetical protein
MDQRESTIRNIQLFLENIYFDAQMGGASPFAGTKEEYIIRLITRSIVALCTAWWSVRELLDYVQKRQTSNKGFNFDSTTFA